eukprot:scaffold470021_cov21-Prasinocladus_malaysianus.AAC.1
MLDKSLNNYAAAYNSRGLCIFTKAAGGFTTTDAVHRDETRRTSIAMNFKMMVTYIQQVDVTACAWLAALCLSRAQDEVVEERVMRELSREATLSLQVLTGMQRSIHLSSATAVRQ